MLPFQGTRKMIVLGGSRRIWQVVEMGGPPAGRNTLKGGNNVPKLEELLSANTAHLDDELGFAI